MKEMPDLSCGKTAVGGNYNSAHDRIGSQQNNLYYKEWDEAIIK